MPDYSYLIAGSLAQGSAPPPGVRLPFDTVVLAAREWQPELPGHEVLRVPLSDDGPPPTPEERRLIHENAARVTRRLRVGRRVLVTCWMGRNRSGVISALALVNLGVDPGRAVGLIQRIRNGLTNSYFLDMVLHSRGDAAARAHLP